MVNKRMTNIAHIDQQPEINMAATITGNTTLHWIQQQNSTGFI
jgi:hypothetical protein